MSEDETYQRSAILISQIMHRGEEVVSEAVEKLAYDGDMSEAVISAIQKEMNEEERVIYFCESFSAQCNMSGLNNFFSDSISLVYYEVVSALETLGSEKMVDALKGCKEVIFGNQDVPVADEERLEEFLDPGRPNWDTIEERLEKIEDDSLEDRERFEHSLSQYTVTCGEAGKIPKANG